MIRVFLLSLLSFVTASALAAPDACEAKAQSKAPGFQRVNGPYTSAAGDFDGDGTKDIAFFIANPKEPKNRAIAVCLSSTKDALLIANLYVSDSLGVAPKGAPFYNYDTDKNDTYPQDGISVSCCECCGATYLYENGTFHQVVDGD